MTAAAGKDCYRRVAVQVPFSDLSSIHRALRAELDGAIARVLDSGRFIMGPEVDSFEDELARYCGTAKAVAVSSGTDALLVALMALGIGPGDKVVTTPFSFFATVGSVLRLGATVEFADIDPDTLLLDGPACADAVDGVTRAVIAVHLFGARATASAGAGVPVVEDAAQAIGAGPPEGACATLSFFPAKNLGALGDGGAVITDDRDLADRIASLRIHGAAPKYTHHRVGGNFRLDALQAAVLRVKLRCLGDWTAARRARAAHYRQLLADAGVAEVTPPAASAGHVYNQFVVQVDDRDSLRQALTDAGIQTAIYYPSPLHLQPCMEGHWRSGQFPNAERACGRVLALPIYPTMTADQQAYVVDRIVEFYRGPR